MIRFLADEDFDGPIVRGLRRRVPKLDLLRIQDAGLGHSTTAKSSIMLAGQPASF